FLALATRLEHQAQKVGDLGSLYLAGAGSRQLGISEANDPDALVRAQLLRDLIEMGSQSILDGTAALSARVRRHDQRRDLFALSDLEADDGHLLDVFGVAVNLFELVDVDVVAAGIDDDFLGAADDVESAVGV